MGASGRRCWVTAAVTVGLLAPSFALAGPAAASPEEPLVEPIAPTVQPAEPPPSAEASLAAEPPESEELNPLDQSTEVDDSLPPLEENVIESLLTEELVEESDGAIHAPYDGTASSYLGPCKQDFIDAPPNGSYYSAITWLACAGITAGDGQGYFGKAREITRGETAQFLYKYSGEHHDPGATRDFTDAGPGDPFFTAISWMKAEGYTAGQANGAFGTRESISRGELAQFLLKISGESSYQAPATSPYTDSRSGSAFYRAAAWLRSSGLVAGYADGTFRTGQNIPRGQTAQFLYALETYLNGRPAPPDPAPIPAPTVVVPVGVSLDYRYVVIADNPLNVRKYPGTQYQVLTRLYRNTGVIITGRSKSVDGVTWREITVGSVRGWVHGGYIIRDFEAGTAKSSYAQNGTVRTPSASNGVIRLGTVWEAQPNGYYCGPATIRIALSAFGTSISQYTLGEQAQTDSEGTWLHQVVRLMDYHSPVGVRYTVTTLPGPGADATYRQRVTFRDDMVRSIRAGVPGVVNIAATPDEQHWIHRQKTGGRFTLRHHMPVVGYNANTNELLVDDPWTEPFWVNAYELADMAVTRGYGSLKGSYS